VDQAYPNGIEVNATIRGDNGSDKLTGGSGNDILVGGSGHDVLIGGDGRDRLRGNGGRDVLIGGAGSDTLAGGLSDDLLIGGFTAYDRDASALDLILAEWSSTRGYEERLSNLRDGTGPVLSGTDVRLNSTDPTRTVFDDDDEDRLKGDKATDWYFASLSDELKDRLADEILDLL
jgi:Ca2+-binding RTX toxin-like protein